MNRQQESKLKRLGIFTLAQAKEAGLSQQSLSRLVEVQKIKRVARGRLVARLVADKNLSEHLVFKGGFVGLMVYDSHRTNELFLTLL